MFHRYLTLRLRIMVGTATCILFELDCYGQYRCVDERCIPRKWKCDGTSDCVDGEDEDACGIMI